jgi:ATP-binding cassette subfamily B (MDR/TAP) protein 1
VYIGIIRFLCTYIYASLFTYTAYHLVQNIQHTYLRAAFSQDISYYDGDTSGSISMQATSNGLLIQAGMSEKIGLFIQSISTFVAAFVIAFMSQWKLTLILFCIVPAVMIVVGGAGGFDAASNTIIFKIYAEAASYAENALTGIKIIHAFGLRSRVLAKYDSYLQDAYHRGMKKSIIYGFLFGGQYFVIYSGMGLAFWQGFGIIGRGEASDLSQIFV